ncbi:hypothetical protein PMIT1323_00394 [Prochlorococcus marinus str. MIT 1323]|nr:hypothetical protein PMIT1323_00394 [Prochlorococcus marinus str. MIT 1323]
MNKAGSATPFRHETSMPQTGSVCSARALGSNSVLNLIQATAFLQKRVDPMVTTGQGRQEKGFTALRVKRISKPPS